MQITIISPGSKPKHARLALVEDYAARISKTIKLELIYPKTDLAQVYLKHIKDNDFVVALDQHGQQFTNTEFASKLDRALSSVSNNIIFVVGGSYGLPEEVKLRADLIWSFSLQVFPHQLFRVILLEQIYRSLQIKKNSNYHH